MNTAPLHKLNAKTATEVCARFQMGGEAKKLLKENATVAQFMELLVAAGQWPEAVKLLTHVMNKREAVAWAADSAREALPAEPNPKALAALSAADAWVKDPSEENRRAAQSAS